jgi:hypothetical protein
MRASWCFVGGAVRGGAAVVVGVGGVGLGMVELLGWWGEVVGDEVV